MKEKTSSSSEASQTPSGEQVASDALLSLRRENERLRAALRQAIEALDKNKDLSDSDVENCHESIRRERYALRHCQAVLR